MTDLWSVTATAERTFYRRDDLSAVYNDNIPSHDALPISEKERVRDSCIVLS